MCNLKILHISDSYNAGVKTAIDYIAKENSNHNHYLLWAAHSDTPETANDSHAFFIQSTEWSGSYFSKIFQMISIAREIEPDIIHLHSSVAGFLGRIFLRRFFIVYSSHCFAFQREDINILAKYFFLLIEILLGKLTKVNAFSWPIEEKIINKYFINSKKLFFPIFDLNQIKNAVISNTYEPNSILSIGRIRPQKDPLYLIEALNMISSPVKCTWYGVGEKPLVQALVNAGVTVSGWAEKSHVRQNSQNYSMSVITSAWESGPLTLIDSISSGIPVICRSIEAIDMYGFQTFETVFDFAAAIEMVLKNSIYRSFLFDQEKESVLNYFKPLYESIQDNYYEIYLQR